MEILKIKVTISVVVIVGCLVFGLYRDYRGRLWGTAGVSSGDVTRLYSKCLRNCETTGMSARTVELELAGAPITQSVVYEDGGNLEHNIGIAGSIPVIPGVAKIQASATTPTFSVNTADLRDVMHRRNANKDLNKVLLSDSEIGQLGLQNKKRSSDWSVFNGLPSKPVTPKVTTRLIPLSADAYRLSSR